MYVQLYPQITRSPDFFVLFLSLLGGGGKNAAGKQPSEGFEPKRPHSIKQIILIVRFKKLKLLN